MLELITPSPLASIQDGGRRGWQAFGVPAGGAMDVFAYRIANLLAANSPDAAALETGPAPVTLLARADLVIAVTGRGFRLSIDGRPANLWASNFVPANRQVEIEPTGGGNWAYLAVHGGIDTPPALGSRSTYLRAPLTEPLLQGAVIPIGNPTHPLINLTGRHFPQKMLPYREKALIRVIPGPQSDLFSQEARSIFYGTPYIPSPTSDRMGYRLGGKALSGYEGGELLSEGMARGCIQVPADGLPIVMQADCPPTGGYPKIASVISADQPILAQIPIGTGEIWFSEINLREAQSIYRNMVRQMKVICPIAADSVW